ncbi:MAG: hypothetical protein ABEL76_01505 [Bradymonadaceae bacterium]
MTSGDVLYLYAVAKCVTTVVVCYAVGLIGFWRALRLKYGQS